jgi:hypothetical protein
MKASVSQNGGSKPPPKSPKLVITYYPGSPTARAACGRPADGGGWEWKVLSAARDPALVGKLSTFYVDNFTGGE